MILSDRDLRRVIAARRLIFRPELMSDQISPASIDLRLSPTFKVFRQSKLSLLNPKEGLPKDFMDTHRLKSGEYFVLHPGNFVLASTIEYIKVPDDMVVRVEGKSTLARMGILVHTAGFVDPGFEGSITLEISNQSNVAMALHPEMYICQIAVHIMSSPAEVPYNVRKKSLYHKAKTTVGANPINLFRKNV